MMGESSSFSLKEGNADGSSSTELKPNPKWERCVYKIWKDTSRQSLLWTWCVAPTQQQRRRRSSPQQKRYQPHQQQQSHPSIPSPPAPNKNKQFSHTLTGTACRASIWGSGRPKGRCWADPAGPMGREGIGGEKDVGVRNQIEIGLGYDWGCKRGECQGRRLQ